MSVLVSSAVTVPSATTNTPYFPPQITALCVYHLICSAHSRACVVSSTPLHDSGWFHQGSRLWEFHGYPPRGLVRRSRSHARPSLALNASAQANQCVCSLLAPPAGDLRSPGGPGSLGATRVLDSVSGRDTRPSLSLVSSQVLHYPDCFKI